MIYYFSDKFEINTEKIKTFKSDKFNISILNKQNLLGLDIEANGLDYHTTEMLLLGISDRINQYIFDYSTFHLVKPILANNNIKFVIHNAKYEIGTIKTNLDILLNNTWCTQVADQRIYQGYGFSKHNLMGIRFGYDYVVQRHLNVSRLSNKEESRARFIGVKQRHYNPIESDLFYLYEDIVNLIPVYESQLIKVKTYNLEYQQSFEQPLVKVLAKMELEGFDFNKEAWLAIYNENKEKAFVLACKLDEFVKKQIPNLEEMRQKILKYEFRNVRYKEPEIVNTDLFGGVANPKVVFSAPKSKKISFNNNIINWESADQVARVLALLGLPVPTTDDVFFVPYLDKDYKITKDKQEYKIKGKAVYTSYGIGIRDYKNYIETNDDKFIKSCSNFTVGVPKFKLYKKLYKNPLMLEFVDLYLSYSDYTNKVNSFGKNYIDKLNPKTGKLHTIYRQCDSLTGRLQSGGGRKQPDKYNSQNLPRDNKFRNCFVAPKGWSIITADLSSAEVVILADKSNDKNVIKMAIEQDDIHSPVATQCWKNIYLYRALKDLGYCNSYSDNATKDNVKEFWQLKKVVGDSWFNPEVIRESAFNLFTLYKEYYITKVINKDKRGDFKSITFGVAYGAYANTVSKALNVSLEEAQIVIETIKYMMPDVFRLIESNVNFVFGISYKDKVYQKPKGYLVFNKVSNSRLYFPTVLDCIKQDIPVDFYIKKDIAGVARNAPIQGTQADMMKDAMVRINNAIEKYNLPAALLMQVHDELVVKCDKRIDGKSEEFKTNPIIINGNPVDFAKYVSTVMTTTANKYLTNIKMKCEYHVADYWLK